MANVPPIAICVNRFYSRTNSAGKRPVTQPGVLGKYVNRTVAVIGRPRFTDGKCLLWGAIFFFDRA